MGLSREGNFQKKPWQTESASNPKTGPPAPICEYIVVGSGAGGGTVAARLAERGYRVTVLEAGGDPRALQGGDPNDPGGNSLPEDYDVPCFHALASENRAISWDFFVRHYADEDRQRKDGKYVVDRGGVL